MNSGRRAEKTPSLSLTLALQPETATVLARNGVALIVVNVAIPLPFVAQTAFVIYPAQRMAPTLHLQHPP